MSQPALSKSIQELEEGLAAQLFFRRKKGVTLTDAGESFYQHAELILTCAQPKRIFANDKGNWQGRLISAWGPVFPQSDASCHISFSSEHPQVKVRIMEGQLVSMINELRQGELDFTINTYYQGPYDHEFTFEKLLEKQFRDFCRPGHPAIGARS